MAKLSYQQKHSQQSEDTSDLKESLQLVIVNEHVQEYEYVAENDDYQVKDVPVISKIY